MAEILPLNGFKTHPLSVHAIADLIEMRDCGPIPRSGVNAGVANRLARESLAEEVQLPSPFKTHAGKNIAHIAITAAGLARLKDLGQ